MPEGACRHAVEVAERLADRLADEKERLAASRALPQGREAHKAQNAVWTVTSALARHVPKMIRAHVYSSNALAQHRAAGDFEVQRRLWEGRVARGHCCPLAP